VVSEYTIEGPRYSHERGKENYLHKSFTRPLASAFMAIVVNNEMLVLFEL
jgi:hypothetical protein